MNKHTRTFTTNITLSPNGEHALQTIGSYLSTLQKQDYKTLINNNTKGPLTNRQERRNTLQEKGLTRRQADSIIHSNRDQYNLALRTNQQNITNWQKDINKNQKTLKKPNLTTKQYHQTQQNIQYLQNKIIKAQNKRARICFGGKKNYQDLVKNPTPGKLLNWKNSRLSLDFEGAAEKDGNATVKYDPVTHEIWVIISKELSLLLGLPRRNLIGTGVFKYGGESIERCLRDREPIKHRFQWVKSKQKWCLYSTARFTSDQLSTKKYSHNINYSAGIDFNAGHVDVTVLDKHGNVVGQRVFDYSSAGDMGRVCDDIFKYFEVFGVWRVGIEKLTGLQRSQASKSNNRGGALNRVVSSLPTGEFKRVMSDLAARRGVILREVNPAGTSKKTSEWQETIYGENTHLKASYLIGRRLLGLSLTRRENNRSHVTSGLDDSSVMSNLVGDHLMIDDDKMIEGLIDSRVVLLSGWFYQVAVSRCQHNILFGNILYK